MPSLVAIVSGQYTTTTYINTDDGIIGPYDCNVGYWLDTWPFVEGECSYTKTATGIAEGFMVECTSDPETGTAGATLYTYDNDECSGTPVNDTNLTYYYCEASADDCTVIEMETKSYYTSDGQCSGDWVGKSNLKLAQVEECVDPYLEYLSLRVSVTSDAVTLSFHSGEGCTGYSPYSVTYEEGCTDNIDVEISEYDGESNTSDAYSIALVKTVTDAITICLTLLFLVLFW